MKYKLLSVIFLFQTVFILASNVPNWPRESDVDEWPVKEFLPKRSKWPKCKKRDLRNRDPFSDSQENIASSESEGVEMMPGDIGAASLATSATSPSKELSKASSADSFFNSDWSTFQSVDPFSTLITEEDDDRKYYENISKAELKILDDENKLVSTCFRNFIENYKTTELYNSQFNELFIAIISLDQRKKFSVNDARKGSCKMQGFSESFERFCAAYLNMCKERRALWAQCVYACSICPNTAQSVFGKLSQDDDL